MTNQRLYTLSIIAAIFLPLGFLTGLFGVNVGGIPGTESSWGFLIVCALMAALGAGQLWLFRKLGWL
jgi:zinc transporter